VPVSIERYPGVLVEETLAGAPGILDLWYWPYEPVGEQTLASACEPLMSAEERERYRVLRFERDRRLFLATRLLVRTALSRYVAVRPGDWRFSPDRSGKPWVVHPAISLTLNFNLANTPGLVTCVVSVAHGSIGVDAERVDRRVEFAHLAARNFSPSEAEALATLPQDEIGRRFFTYWTLKESYVKARGLGLAMPLDRFSFSVLGDQVTVTFHDAADLAEAWKFASIEVPSDHLVAVAARTEGAPLSVRASRLEPLAGVTPHD
jgi:4'-phosphopantetheinyl transferase